MKMLLSKIPSMETVNSVVKLALIVAEGVKGICTIFKKKAAIRKTKGRARN